MQTPPVIPQAALEAATPALDRYVETDALDVAHEVLTLALPFLLPGLYVTRHGGDLTVWRDDPDYPERPEALDSIAVASALAALLPDRTDDEAAKRPRCSACHCAAGSHDESGMCWAPECSCPGYMPTRTEWDG